MADRRPGLRAAGPDPAGHLPRTTNHEEERAMDRTGWHVRVHHAVAALAATLLALVAGPGWTQPFPQRPVTIIVPWSAGGGTDIAMRAFAQAAQKHLGQPIVIENRPGAAGTLGPGQMARTARPDGYTLSQMPLSLFRLPHMQKVDFDPVNDFTWIAMISGYTFGVVVRADSPFKTFRDLIAFARAHPGKLTYATPGTGTTLHITMEDIAVREGIVWTHVPFKGQADGTAALLGGHVMAQADSTGWAELVEAGKLRLLVTWGEHRTKRWPAVPTLRETGFDLVANSPYGIAGPRGMDPKVVRILQDAFLKALDDPEYLKTIARLDQHNFWMPSDEYTKYAQRTFETERVFLHKLGLIKPAP
jgi:tripartite-type tricarboxylate transporter receptor subunit TctC